MRPSQYSAGYVDEFAELLEELLEQRQPVELHLSTLAATARGAARFLPPRTMDG